MKTIEWHLSTGIQGCDHSGEFQVEDTATEEEIDHLAREEAFNFIEWGWNEKQKA